MYVSQTLDAFAPAVELDQAQATTHPFHDDSICLNGLGCTTSVPEGDRSHTYLDPTDRAASFAVPLP